MTTFRDYYVILCLFYAIAHHVKEDPSKYDAGSAPAVIGVHQVLGERGKDKSSCRRELDSAQNVKLSPTPEPQTEMPVAKLLRLSK